MVWSPLESPASQVATAALPRAMFTILSSSSTVTWVSRSQSPVQGSIAVVAVALALGWGVATVGDGDGDGVGVGEAVGEVVGGSDPVGDCVGVRLTVAVGVLLGTAVVVGDRVGEWVGI